ncbi:MAG TPA: 3'-5' exonuclease [Chloroflexia bacterium]|nr:3'-5' exonuclease [Chloroflexia bacterium]
MADHQLSAVAAGYRCATCGWSWKYTPSDWCPGVPRYIVATTPPNLKTRTELRALGRNPGGPARACRYRVSYHEWISLYDLGEAIARRTCSPAQLAALAKARAAIEEAKRAADEAEHLAKVARWLAKRARRAADKAAAAAWARELLAATDWAILDLETTGLDPQADRIVQIGVLLPGGVSGLESLVNPGIPIPQAATAIHGITDDQVADAPGFGDLYPQLCAILAGRQVVIYNASFDWPFIEAACARLGAPPPAVADTLCAMLAYAAWVNEVRSSGGYRWQRLPAGDHTALGDCRATLRVIGWMAEPQAAVVEEEGDVNDDQAAIDLQ